MYIDRRTTTVNGKSHTRVLLRRSVRAGKKVTHAVVANLPGWPPQDIAALELALRHRRALAALHALDNQVVQLRQGAGIGAVWRLAETHAACAVLVTAPFTEDHLYASLAWLADEQPHIEHVLQTQQLQMQLFDGTLHEVYDAEWGNTICHLHRKLRLRVLMAVK